MEKGTCTLRKSIFVLTFFLYFSPCLGFYQHKSCSYGSSEIIQKKSGFKVVSMSLVEQKKIAIFGSTGGVGFLVTEKLLGSGKYILKAHVRDIEKAKSLFSSDLISFAQGNFLDGSGVSEALDGVSAVVCCTGTTAFPSGKWKGGNTPHNVDKAAIANLVQKCEQLSAIKKFILLTSIGVERTDTFPFSILNTFGVLECKRAGEISLIQGAQKMGFDYVIVRPGRLVGAPFSNPDVANAFKISQSTKRAIVLEEGDSLAGDMSRTDTAEIIVRALENAVFTNKVFSAINVEGPEPAENFWMNPFRSI